MSTAAIVPSWMTAVNAAPGSAQPSSLGTMSRCAELEMGRNSVRPCTIPKTVACTKSTGWVLLLGGVGGAGGQTNWGSLASLLGRRTRGATLRLRDRQPTRLRAAGHDTRGPQRGRRFAGGPRPRAPPRPPGGGEGGEAGG